MNELNISNEALLNELGERIKKGEIMVKDNSLITSSENNNIFCSIKLKLDVVRLLENDIKDLQEALVLTRKERER
jgi:hypothetical protein